MKEDEGELISLPYAVWYQCKTCTNLFYNKKSQIDEHLESDAHRLKCISSNQCTQKQQLSQSQHSNVTTTTSSVNIRRNNNNNISKASFAAVNGLMRSGLPLKIKERHITRPQITSVSPGLDGEEYNSSLAEELLLNNNNNNNISNNEYASAVPRRKMRNFNFLKNNVQLPIERRPNRRIHEEDAIHQDDQQIYLENVRQQLRKTDIDISEIKMNNSIGEGEMIDEDEEGLEVGYDYEEAEDQDMSNMTRDFQSENYEDQEDEEPEEQEMLEDCEEGASTSNQSFYDNGMGGHFLFQNPEADNESESNYEDDGSIITPSFGMVDEFLRNAGGFARSTSSTSPPEAGTSGGRKRSQNNPCTICRKTFTSLSKLRNHAKKEHLNKEGGSQHVCKFCYNYFPSAARLSKHLNVHQGENPNVCNICEKSFTSWATLRTHLKIHSGERPFGCEYCGQRFQTKSTLDSHLRIHTGARPHHCPYCDKTFRTSSPLYRHMRSVHKGVNLAVTDS